MDSGLVTSLSGAVAQSRRIEVIANNLANADTPGFKADELLFEESLQAAHREDNRSDIQERPFTESELASRAGDENRPVLYGEEFTSMRMGALRKTSNPLDIAIEGNGFLEVLSPNGVRLTRAGNLSRDPGGRLVNRDGFLVLGPGTPGQDPALRAITLPEGKVVIDVEGNIYAGGTREEGAAPVGRLGLVAVENPRGLKKSGGTLFEATPEAFARPAGTPAPARGPASGAQSAAPKANPLGAANVAPKVHQGMLESSNVNPIEQMSKMIEAHRLFDQNTKLMQSFGELNSRSAEIGRF